MAKTLEDITNSLFADAETLTKEAFEEAVSKSGLKLADLSEGDFVTVGKYNDHVAKYQKLKTDYDKLVGGPDKDTLIAERDQYANQYNEAMKKLNSYEHSKILQDLKVDPSFIGFVEHEVNGKVTDGVDFKQAATDYLKTNKQFITSPNNLSGLMLEGGKPASKSLFGDLNDFLRGV